MNFYGLQYPLVFKPWTPTVAEELSEITIVPIWVLFPNLDPFFWSQTALSKVASFVDRPICADEPTTSKSKIAFARILVEVGLSKDLPKGMTLQTPYRGTVLQKIDYEWVPHFCHSCKRIGHTQDRCSRNKPKQVYKPKQSAPQPDPVAKPVQDTKGFKVTPPKNTPKKTTVAAIVIPSTTLENQFSTLATEPVVVNIGDELWVLWNPITVDVQVLDRGAQFIHCSLLHHVTQRKIVVTFVYALNRATERLSLWNSLTNISTGQLPWICLGDFNVSLEADEKIGSQVASPKWAKLDRLLVNPIWFSHVPASTVVFLPAGVSDHAPTVLTIPGQRTPPRSFKYLNCWALSPDFGSIIAAQWSPAVYGTKIFALFSKLRRLRDSLKKLHHSDFTGITKRVTEAKARLTQCQFLLQSSPLNQLLLAKEKDTASEYMRLKKAEMHFLAQKAKIQHLQLSDTNTRYFYASISARQRRNTIGSIADITGRLFHGHEQVAEAFVGYYKLLLGSEEQVQPLPADLFAHNTLESVSHLDNPVTISEIKAVLHSIDRNKSPGMDGYTSSFFVDTWETTGQDFCDAAHLLLHCILQDCEQDLGQQDERSFRGIIGLEQAAFIEGRDLFDNSMLAHELAFKYHRSYITPRCILKVDIQKAFDSVNWSFLANCMVHFGFPAKFIQWILACVTSSHFSISVNGSTEGFFPGKRGLRKGDPLSPYLFTMCMEVLSRLLRQLPSHHGFSYHPKCVKIKLTHLIFADDLLVFTRGDLPSIQAVDHCLNNFAALSGLRVNPMKSNLYFGGVSLQLKQHILATT
ncbi:uncharacterized protein LOC141651831 [Silene latifolia]|uniref:uncharacterized protein LOC141651831 n=1 Tax=Silene latifolia TaxID=37657 RepID=UPI003D77EEA2